MWKNYKELNNCKNNLYLQKFNQNLKKQSKSCFNAKSLFKIEEILKIIYKIRKKNYSKIYKN